MDVATITMEPEKARKKLEAFRDERHKDAEQFARACEEGYAALGQGTPLISLTQAIVNGGVDDEGLPCIAVARSDRMEVCFRWLTGWRDQGQCLFTTASDPWNPQERRRPTLNQRINWEMPDGANTDRMYATVPTVPPDVRPKTGQLKDWFTLFEVDQWTRQSRRASASRDPYLLKHIGGDLYAVLAEWELTDLEVAVMNGLIRES